MFIFCNFESIKYYKPHSKFKQKRFIPGSFFMKNKLLKLIKSVHVISHLPIYVFNQDFHLEHLFVADRVQVLPYDFTQCCCSEPSSNFLFSGILDEAFITYSSSDTILIIGPFTTSHLTNAMIRNRVQA